jgi:hypothetical protein
VTLYTVTATVTIEVLDPVTLDCVLTGTAVAGMTPAQVKTGGRKIVATLGGTTWAPGIGQANAQTTALLQGLASNKSEPNGWNARVRPALRNTHLTVSGSVLTLTLPAVAAYAITQSETVTWTIPDTAYVVPATVGPSDVLVMDPDGQVAVLADGFRRVVV